MKTRIISGVVIGILCVGLGLLGGIPLGLVLMACAMIGYYELTRALGVHDAAHEKCNMLEITGLTAAAVLYVCLILAGRLSVTIVKDGPIMTWSPDDSMPFLHIANSLTLMVIIADVLVTMGIYVFTFPKYHADQVIDAIFSFLYAPVMMSCIFRAEYLPYGKFVYALIFLCSWVCDSGAWAFGRAFGRHKMAPQLSPHKTVEGGIGGVLSGTVLCFLAAVLVAILVPGERVYGAFILIGIIGSIIGMIGDLAASAIKRNHDIKDYGKIIPGHGGIMDRFDSVIFTAPAIYVLAVVFLEVMR